MKISKKSWFTIALGFLVMAAASLSVVYYQRASEREQLEADLFLARSKLNSVDMSTLTYQQENLEGDLNKAYKEYEADKDVQPKDRLKNIAKAKITAALAGAATNKANAVWNSDIKVRVDTAMAGKTKADFIKAYTNAIKAIAITP